MFWLLSAMILYGFAMLLIGILLVAATGNPLVRHLQAHSMAVALRHSRTDRA